jgi:hypothetical protein
VIYRGRDQPNLRVVAHDEQESETVLAFEPVE